VRRFARDLDYIVNPRIKALALVTVQELCSLLKALDTFADEEELSPEKIRNAGMGARQRK
jgi:hypothetical protein